MPSPRDMTGELVRMRGQRPLQEVDSREDGHAEVMMRPMAFDPVLWISGSVILFGLAFQAALVVWMW